MAIPATPLKFREDFVPDDLTLDEVCLFDTRGFSSFTFRDFLLMHTRWTPKEIGAITRKEIRNVYNLALTTLGELMVPPAKGTPYDAGQD